MTASSGTRSSTRALAEIDDGVVEKVVLAREVASRPTRRSTLPRSSRRLATQQPGCFVYAADGLVGASPELLVRRRGDDVESLPDGGHRRRRRRRASLRALAAP